MDRALVNVIRFTGLPLKDALVMLTATPARSVRVNERKGQLKPGFDADVILLDRDYTVHRTLVGGETVYQLDSVKSGG